MKKNLLQLTLIAIFIFGSVTLKAQLLLDENFDYTSGNPLVEGAVASSDNASTTKTGWLTMSNSGAGTNCFNIASAGLTYSGYAGSGIGKALNILDNDGQDVFKTFSSSNTTPTPGASFQGPKTVYIAFLINVPAGDKTGTEFFAGIKYSNSATDANYMGRIFAKVNGNNVQFGISKSTTPATVWTGDYPVGTTHLLVLKYNMGGLNGTTSAEETNKYDDKVDLFVNPPIGTAEPASSSLHYENSADKDAYRYSSSNSIIGGLAAMYLRTPATGAIPASTIDGLRIGDTWQKVVASKTTAVKTLKAEETVHVWVDQLNRKLNVNTQNNDYNNFEVYSITGVKIKSGKVNQSSFNIDINEFKSGVYLFRLVGTSKIYSSKVLFE